MNADYHKTPPVSIALPVTTGLQHETKCKEFKISQRVPATEKIKESSLKGPSLLFSCVPLPHFER